MMSLVRRKITKYKIIGLKKSNNIIDFLAQINYWREKLGVDYIGLGSGFNSDDR